MDMLLKKKKITRQLIFLYWTESSLYEFIFDEIVLFICYYIPLDFLNIFMTMLHLNQLSHAAEVRSVHCNQRYEPVGTKI